MPARRAISLGVKPDHSARDWISSRSFSGSTMSHVLAKVPFA